MRSAALRMRSLKTGSTFTPKVVELICFPQEGLQPDNKKGATFCV